MVVLVEISIAPPSDLFEFQVHQERHHHGDEPHGSVGVNDYGERRRGTILVDAVPMQRQREGQEHHLLEFARRDWG